MRTFRTVNDSPAGPQIHEAALRAGEVACPYCGAPVSRKQYRKILAKIEAEERARIAKVEQTLKDKLTREHQQAAAKVRAEAEKAKKDAAAQVEKVKREATARESAIRQQATKAATAAFAPRITEAVNAEKQRSYTEKLKLTEQLEDMKRRLEKKTANELGDEGELDLFQQLKQEFPNDQIERVKKGKQGADISHRIVGQNGQICGKILYDVKNTSRLLPRYLTKLRTDQLREEADHGVLSTQACTQQLAVREGVVIVHPARAIALAHLLRHQVLQVYGLRLGSEGRTEKAQRLYRFMLSDRASHWWNEIADAANELDALDRSEKISHEKIWARRTDLIRHVQEAHHSFAEAIDRIIAATGSEASP